MLIRPLAKRMEKCTTSYIDAPDWAFRREHEAVASLVSCRNTSAQMRMLIPMINDRNRYKFINFNSHWRD